MEGANEAGRKNERAMIRLLFYFENAYITTGEKDSPSPHGLSRSRIDCSPNFIT